MPNWCENDLIIYADEPTITAIAELLKSDDSAFDFDRVIPMPEVFKNLHSGMTTIDGKRYEFWREAEVDGEIVCTGVEDEEIKAWKKTYGIAGWYDWCCSNWGTKWNAGSEAEVIVSDGRLEAHFSTAWSPPTPVIEALIAKFPDVAVCFEYFECGAAYCGGINYNGGELSHWSGDYQGSRGG